MKNAATVIVQQVESGQQPALLSRTQSGSQNQQKSASTFMDTCTKVEASNISKTIAFFFFRCNIVFKIVGAKAFRKVISVLRPANAAKFLFYRDKLRTTLLD